MRFVYAESMTDPEFYPALARCAEENGFDRMTVPDSIFYPKESSSQYPYNADGTREFLDDKPFIEPFCLISALAMVTRTLRFSTFVLKLPLHHPVHVAKQAASVAVLSGDRLDLGVGSSPWPDDYEVIGVPLSQRGQRMDECVQIVRGLTAGGYFSFSGEHYTFPEIKICPTPASPLPILIGGHGPAALRRAAQLGDGWMFAGGGTEPLPVLLAELQRLREEAGRADQPFAIFAGSLEGYTPDGIRRLEDMGVTDVVVGFRDPYAAGPDVQPLEEKLAAIRQYADSVIRS